MYSGGAIMPLVDLFKLKQINYYINNHEQNCGHAATGYAKSSNRTGVAIVTSGPGLTNMVTPILDATNDSTPLVVFSGQVPLSAMGTLAFQECPAIEITQPCTKWSYCADLNDDLYELTNEAFRVANTGKKGAVHIDLPKCILTNLNGTNIVKHAEKNDFELKFDYEYYKNIIMASDRPVIYIGKGCNDASEELYTFAKKYNIHVTSTIHSVGTYNERNSLALGFLGMHGYPVANHTIQNADLIIALGSRFDDRTTGNIKKYAPKCKNIIHVNIEKSELGKVIADREGRKLHKLHTTCKNFLKYMNILHVSKKEAHRVERIEWKKQIDLWRRVDPIAYNRPANNKLNTQMVIDQLNKHIDQNNTIITSGVGNHQMMACQFITWTRPNQFITSGSLGVMGVGLPYAIGAQLANPNKVVIDIDGDGSFNHTLADLQTVKRYNIPIKIFIMNDKNMSMVRAWEKLFYNENYIATDCSFNPDYSALANSYGIHSVDINTIDELNEKIIYVLKYKGPILCNVNVQTDLCLPLVAPGKGLDEMITIYNYKGDEKLTGQAPS
jgi:acetolactate synthase-1/2/3 large subunit